MKKQGVAQGQQPPQGQGATPRQPQSRPAQTSTKKRLSAAVYYLLTGLALGWPGLLATGHLLPDWRMGATLSGLSLAVIHVLVLGSMLTIACGVLYQIVPIAFQAPPIPRHVLYWHLPLHVLSVCLMVVGFWRMDFLLVGIGGTLLCLAAAAFFSFVLQSYRRARNKTVVHRSLSLPFAALALVLLFGLFQAFFPAHATQGVLLTHVLLGGFAFWGGLVLVFSYKLIPMFALSHGYRASLPRTAALYFGGVVLWIASAWFPTFTGPHIVMGLSALLIIAGLASFVVDIVAILRARKRRRLVLPLWDAFAAMICMVTGETGVVCAVLFHLPQDLYAFIYLFAFGGLLPLMFAYMQKMVPFLWFEYRYSKRPERKSAPLIDDMVHRRTAQAGLALYFVGVLLQFAMFVLPTSVGLLQTLAWVGAAYMTFGSVLVFWALRRVLTIGGTRPPDGVPVQSSSPPDRVASAIAHPPM